MTESVQLTRVAILADPGEPSYVIHGVRDLQEYIAAVTGETPDILERWDDNVSTWPVTIAVGRNVLRRLAEQGVSVPDVQSMELGLEGFILSSATWPSTGRPIVAVAGHAAQGTKHGVIALAKAIGVDEDAAHVTLPLDRVGRPAFAKRGMYAHLHWQYAHPYALRSWSVDDWKRYVDLLAYLHINLLQIWSMEGLLPHPLTAGDRAYLEKLQAIVTYAQEVRGMEVWIGECANNIARADGGVPGVPIEQREYFTTESLQNPADPAQRQRIMAAREDLYRIVSKADGYWIIDSDPGGWPGSPTREFVDIMLDNRRLIDRCTEKGREAKLVYWMHWGWGIEAPSENWGTALDDMSARLPEPWWLTPNVQHLDAVDERHLRDKSVFFPYGSIEPEPSPPLTQFYHARLKQMVEVGLGHPGLQGMLGQAQTPFVQLPNIFFLANALWDRERRHQTIADSVRDLATLLYPRAGDLVGRAWVLLDSSAAEDILTVADQLDAAVQGGDLGPPGPLGRCIFPEPERVAADLAYLLRIKGYAELFRQRLDVSDHLAASRESLAAYVRAVLSWQERHGYNAMGGAKYVYSQYLTPVRESYQRFAALSRQHGASFDILWPVKSALNQERRFHPAAIDLALGEATGQDR